MGFVVRNDEDEEGEVIEGTHEDTDYLVGRAGDHLVTPYQCEMCHFRNIFGRDPKAEWMDTRVCQFIRRATLDSFWDRSSATIGAQVREVRRLVREGEEFGFPDILPQMGPWPLKDVCGMKTAVTMLKRSLDPGRTEKVVQFDTVRKLRSAVTNLHQASVDGLHDRVGAYERSKMWISSVPTHSFWFTRFMGGNHKRVGQKKIQDEPILIQTLCGLQEMWERMWKETRNRKERGQIATQATWYLVGFCCGLRGEEMLLILGHATLASLEVHGKSGLPHFEVIISGATKGNRRRGARFSVPCVTVTKGSGLLPGLWLSRMGEFLDFPRGSRLFRVDKEKVVLKDFHHLFYSGLERGKEEGVEGIKEGEVREIYGILRSLRRGTTAHARNNGVSVDLLNAVNRWRKHKDSRTNAPRLDMDEVYTQLEAIKPTILRFSSAL